MLSASKLDRDFSHCYPTLKLFEEHWGMTKVMSYVAVRGVLVEQAQLSVI